MSCAGLHAVSRQTRGRRSGRVVRLSTLPAALPAVSGSAGRFLTVSDLFRLAVSPMNTWFLGVSGLA